MDSLPLMAWHASSNTPKSHANTSGQRPSLLRRSRRLVRPVCSNVVPSDSASWLTTSGRSGEGGSCGEGLKPCQPCQYLQDQQ